jgi:hypothetical protein
MTDKTDCTCPKCGEPAEEGSVVDMRDSGGRKFKEYIHNRQDGALEIVDDFCVEILSE